MASPMKEALPPHAAGRRSPHGGAPLHHHHHQHPHCSTLDACAAGADDCPHHATQHFDAVMPHDLDFIPTRNATREMFTRKRSDSIKEEREDGVPDAILGQPLPSGHSVAAATVPEEPSAEQEDGATGHSEGVHRKLGPGYTVIGGAAGEARAQSDGDART
ncbi:PREDICTED: uncharacterized protein LOC106819044 [Priapulus caudatus]|uniref:Uncharacterized protein LOC106819044 n=1 Tax=Priapulus caudatus TaxID=37621 RepID=A0ABM1F419_PRICU|nr:PREDICTED: uncharacterized protein LOC106819044 [Priapulus caudatus]